MCVPCILCVGNAYREYSDKMRDMALLSNVQAIASYTHRNYFPSRVHFVYEKPKNLREHYWLFNCSLTFNQPRTEIIYEQYILNQHQKQVTYRLLEDLKAKVKDEMAQLPAEATLIHEVKKCILSAKPERISIGSAATELHMSTRTLQRKPKALATSFKALEYELQLRLAKTYLEENPKSIDEISYLLGFSESSAFIRFFKSVAGISPTAYRKSKYC